MLFQVVRGGIELVWVLGRSRGPSAPRILTLVLALRAHAEDELSKRSSCRQTARNGYVAQFSFFGSNASPFFQIVNAIAEIFRASVSRAISLRMPRFSNSCK